VLRKASASSPTQDEVAAVAFATRLYGSRDYEQLVSTTRRLGEKASTASHRRERPDDSRFDALKPVAGPVRPG